MRRIHVPLLLAVTAALFVIPGAATAASAEVCASGTTPFCSELGSSVAATTAAAPSDLSFDLSNTSDARESDQTRWWKSVTLSLGQDALHTAKLASDLPEGLIVAGSRDAQDTCVPAQDDTYNATACPAGYGDALVKVTNTVLGIPSTTYSDAHFGIIDIHTVRTDAGTTRYQVDVSVTYSRSANAEPTTSTGSFLLTGVPTSSGAPGVEIPVTWQQSYSTGIGTGSADLSFDSLHLTFRGTSDETTTGSVDPTTVVSLPRACGADEFVVGATDRSGATVSHTDAVTIGGCPTVTSLKASAGPSPQQLTFTAAASAGARPVSGYYWTFGDGSAARTTTPTVTHQYVTSTPRSVTVTALDSAGAISDAVPVKLAGTTVTAAQVGVAKLAGTIADASSGKRIDGTVRLYRCSSGAKTISACNRVATTSSKAGTWSFSIPRPSSKLVYVVATDGSASRIGGLQYVAVWPTSRIKFHAPKKVTHNHLFKLTGRVFSPGQPGKYVVIQRRVGKSWKTFTKIRLNGSSTYTKRVKLHRGTSYLRAVMPTSKVSLTAVSWPRRVSAR